MGDASRASGDADDALAGCRRRGGCLGSFDDGQRLIGNGEGGVAAGAGARASAASSTSRVWRMASATRTSCTGFPAKRAPSAGASAARITTSAAAISASDSGSAAPPASCVSTRIG
jgi:hypothetical protein